MHIVSGWANDRRDWNHSASAHPAATNRSICPVFLGTSSHESLCTSFPLFFDFEQVHPQCAPRPRLPSKLTNHDCSWFPDRFRWVLALLCGMAKHCFTNLVILQSIFQLSHFSYRQVKRHSIIHLAFWPTSTILCSQSWLRCAKCAYVQCEYWRYCCCHHLLNYLIRDWH